MSGTDIFLSYARQDRPAARMVAEALVEEGFHVWWDASLHSGETFDEVIEQKLRDAKAVIVLWSPRSVASRWVRAEATLADRRNKLIPAIIEDCDRPIAFELTHTAELADWQGDRSDAEWRELVDDLKRLVDAEPPVPEPARRQPLRPGNEQVVSVDRFRAAHSPRTGAPPVAATAEVHCLEAEDSDVANGPIVIDSSSVRIGRAAPADIVLSHPSISREHCIIGLANDELFVTDLNSTNGTYIDDARISRATILPLGSIVRLGEVSLRHTIVTKAEANAREHVRPQSARIAVPS